MSVSAFTTAAPMNRQRRVGLDYHGRKVTLEGEFDGSKMSMVYGELAVRGSKLNKGEIMDAHIRIEFIRRSDTVEVAKLATFDEHALVDYGLREYYDSFDKLPQWLQTKIMKLQSMPNPPPRIDIKNLGTKVSDGIYWIVGPEDETHDTDS